MLLIPAKNHDEGQISDWEYSRREAFLLELARALHINGAPAYRIENAMGVLATKMGIEAQFFCTPTAIFGSFHSGQRQKTNLLRVNPGEDDLEKLSRVDGITRKVLNGTMSIQEGHLALETLERQAPRYGKRVTVEAFALQSAGAAIFFGAGALEVLVGGLIGLAIGLLVLGARQWPTVGRLFPTLAALLASLIAVLGQKWLGLHTPLIATIAGLIVLVPGMTVTTAVAELATNNLVSGTARMAGAAVFLVQLGFGLALGNFLGAGLVAGLPATQPVGLPGSMLWLGLAVAPIGLLVLFRAKPADFPYVMGSCVLAFLVTRYASESFGAVLGAFFGALALGTTGRVFSQLFDRPAAIFQTPGMILLVPGSIGFRSVNSLLENQVVSGLETAFTMILVAIALASGLFTAGMFVPARDVGEG